MSARRFFAEKYFVKRKIIVQRSYVMNQKGAIEDARTLGTPKMLLLGLQHMFAMLAQRF